jgi:hypothetical protein
MKTKYIALTTILVLGLAAALFAVEDPSNTAAPVLIRLKSKGATVAELNIPKDAELTLTSSKSTQDKATGRIILTGHVTIHTKQAGGSPITIKTDEIEVTPASR